MALSEALTFLGLMQRAGRAVSGEDNVMAALKKNPKEGLLLIANDASLGTKKKYTIMAEMKKIPVLSPADKKQLGEALGKPERTLVLLSDPAMIRRFSEKLNDLGGGQHGN